MFRFTGKLLAVVALGLLATLAAWADEENIRVEDLPKAVVDAVKAKYPEAKLVGAEKETKGDKTFYEVMLKNKGQDIELLLTPAGKIVVVERELAAADLPIAIARALEKKFPKGTVKHVEEVTRDEEATYSVVLDNDVMVGKEKQKAQVQVAADGTIARTQMLIAAADLPKAVALALETKHPRATIDRVNEIVQGKAESYLVLFQWNEGHFGTIMDKDGKMLKEFSRPAPKK